MPIFNLTLPDHSSSVAITLISDIHLEYLPDNFYNIPKPRKIPQKYRSQKKSKSKTKSGKKTTSSRPSRPLKPLTTICVLAGDIGHPLRDYYRTFLADVRSKFDYVIVIAGNHEYYQQNVGHDNSDAGSDGPGKRKSGKSKGERDSPAWKPDEPQNMNRIKRQIRKVCSETDCIFLERQIWKLDKITFIGATLWSHLPQNVKRNVKLFQRRLPVFRQIQYKGEPLSQADYNQFNKRDIDFIKREVKRAEREGQIAVVLTHYAPTWDLVQKKYHDDILSYGFANDLDDILIAPIRLWLSGHLHNTAIVEYDYTTCMANCVGHNPFDKVARKRENPDFEPNLQIVL